MELRYKDPTATKDYVVKWQKRLVADTLATATFTVPAGLTKASESNTATDATVWLSGGTANESYKILCTVTTAGGRTDKYAFRLKIKPV